MRGATAVVLAIVAWIALYVMTRGSEWAGIVALAATIGALGVGIVVARRAEPRSPDALVGIAGAVLAGLPMLMVALAVLFLLLGWSELR